MVIPPSEKPMEKGGLAKEKFEYRREMAYKVKCALKKKGLDEKISIWGAECTGANETFSKWLYGFEKEKKPQLKFHLTTVKPKATT